MTLVLFFLCCYGVCFALRSSSLLERPRTWLIRRSLFASELLACAFCTGFHVGWFSYLLLWPLLLGPWGLLPAAFASATFCYALDIALLYLERR